MKRDLISFALWSQDELAAILELARRLKTGEVKEYTPLNNKSAALIFERESLRTRVSFEVCIAQLGGHPVFLQQETIGMATRESVHDIGSVLSHYNELIIARTLRHQTVVQLAESATVPVINAMTDLLHPCQILSDVFTLHELGKFEPETKIVYLGNGNNISNSLIELAEKFPVHLVISCPSGYEPHSQILEQAHAAKISDIEIIEDPFQAVVDADVVYTDKWPTSVDSVENTGLQKTFKSYQVNRPLLSHAKRECVVMHRLPANRGEEITHDVLDGKQSVVLQQAENRLHLQKGIIGFLLR
ncbi:MAG TPA: ornithine carbamoyltransferase [Bacteroidetes bacterium]|nr:ornithine carbamoyltransferase [Bacteroidota bacterium]